MEDNIQLEKSFMNKFSHSQYIIQKDYFDHISNVKEIQNKNHILVNLFHLQVDISGEKKRTASRIKPTFVDELQDTKDFFN